MEDPIVVHLPADAAAPIKRSRPYLAGCGIMARLPSKVRVRRDEEGPYFLAGPHPRYYRKCEGCVAQLGGWDGGVG